MILDFSRVSFIDVSAARAVETIACDAKLSNTTVYVTGMRDEVRKNLRGLNADHCLPDDTYYEDRVDALRAAVINMEEKGFVAKSASSASSSILDSPEH